MDDKVWEELLRSPYEQAPKHDKTPKQPKSNSSGVAGLVVGLMAAVVVGATIGWVLAPDTLEEIAAPTTTNTSEAPTSTTAPGPTPPGFLAGFAPLGDTAFEPIVQFESAGRTYVAISEIVASDGDRTETAPTVVGRYLSPIDSGVVASLREITAVAAPGIRLIEFDVIPGEASLQLELGTKPVVQSGCADCIPFLPDESDTTFAFTGFPMEIDDPSLDVVLPGGQIISFDRILLEDEWGIVDWHVESDDALVAQVKLFVFFLDTATEQADGSSTGPATLMPRGEFGARFGQSQPPAPPGMAPSGQIQLSRVGPHLTSENQPSGVAIRSTVTWTVPTAESTSLDPAPLWGSSR